MPRRRHRLLAPSLLPTLLAACSSDPASPSPGGGAAAPPIEPLQNVGAIAIGGTWAGCGVLGDGTVRCWGPDTRGQNGDGDTEPSSGLVIVQGLSSASAVGVGDAHRCAVLADGGVTCWGANDAGQLGNGLPPPPPGAGPAEALRGANSPAQSAVPMPVEGIAEATAIAASSSATCVATSAGTVDCWGDLRGLSQRAQLTGVDGIVDLAFGLTGHGVHLLTSAGAVLTWSWPESHDEDPARVVPGPVIPGAVELEGGDFHLCALTAAGEVACWGANIYDVLGVSGEGTRRSDEPLRVDLPAPALALGAGEHHNCVVLGDGSVWCWGLIGLSAGRGSSSRGLPVQVGGVEHAVDISRGGDISCAILEDTTARCWSLMEVGSGRAVSATPL